MTQASFSLDNSHSQEFLSLNTGREVDARFPWPRLMDGQPRGYELLQFGILGVLDGSLSPQAAADQLAEGLERWYKP